jgi:hypothetical protein
VTAGRRPRLDACSRAREQTGRGRGGAEQSYTRARDGREDCPNKAEATGCGAGPALMRSGPAGRPGAPASAARRSHGGTPRPRTRPGSTQSGRPRELPHDACRLPAPRLGPVISAAEYPDLDAAPACHRGRRQRASRRGESHPPPLSGPDVTVSRHPAPTVRLAVKAISCQWANRSGLYW